MKLAGRKSALTIPPPAFARPPPIPTMVYSTDRSKAVVPVLVLGSGKGCGLWLWHSLDFSLTFFTLCCFVVYSTRWLVLCLALCYFVLVFFSPFSIAITSLGEERANRSIFVCLFDLCLFGFVYFLFLLVSGKGCGLWLWLSLDFSLTPFFLSYLWTWTQYTLD